MYWVSTALAASAAFRLQMPARNGYGVGIHPKGATRKESLLATKSSILHMLGTVGISALHLGLGGKEHTRFLQAG